MQINELSMHHINEDAWQSYDIAAEKLIHGNPRQAVQNHYASIDGCLSVGFWKAECAKWKVQYTEDEYCEMMAGEIEIIAHDGARIFVKAGDKFTVHAGFVGTWEVLKPASKLYVIYEK